MIGIVNLAIMMVFVINAKKHIIGINKTTFLILIIKDVFKKINAITNLVMVELAVKNGAGVIIVGTLGANKKAIALDALKVTITTQQISCANHYLLGLANKCKDVIKAILVVKSVHSVWSVGSAKTKQEVNA